MRILLLTNEYPPHIYGGAGVHVAHLSRELVRLDHWRHHLQVLCFGDHDDSPQAVVDQAIGVGGIRAPGDAINSLNYAKVLDPLYRNLIMTGSATRVDLIHCHTWYTYLAGILLKQIMQVPLAITIHSLEPHRPWKRKQLAEGYHVTCWLERTAMVAADRIIAVSAAMKQDVVDLYPVDPDRVEVIHNGIDLRQYRPVKQPDIPASYGIDPRIPYVLFVGRVTHQKGILHLVNALPHLMPGTQAVLCAGAPDTRAIAEEMAGRVADAQRRTDNPIIWVEKMVPEADLAALYSDAAVFVCPSVYEPFGIINLEAMACGTPVVAAAVGGIPEVVVHDRTGLLVPFTPVGDSDPEPRDPERYALDLAAAVNSLLSSPGKRRAMGRYARELVETRFGWNRIADQTLQCYTEMTRNTA